MLAIAEIAALGANDADRDRSLESEWCSDRNRPLTYLYSVRVADGGGGQLSVCVDLYDCEICLPVRTDDLGFILGRVVKELHLDAIGAVDDVKVGDDVAIRV